MILLSKSIFHAGLSLLLVVVSIGVLFGFYGSEFLFLAQIMIYGGGILVLILFATMVISKEKALHDYGNLSLPLVLAGSGIILIVATYIEALQPRGIPSTVSTKELGTKLLLDYSLPLEIAGILLLVSLLAAIISAMQKPHQA